MKHRYRVMIGFLMMSFLALLGHGSRVSQAAGSIIYVDADAVGAENGTSWTDAFTNLQSAVDVAVDGDQIWVAEGTYKPSFPEGRQATFQLKSGIALFGGFNPSVNDVEWDDRNWETNLTILSGDIGTEGSISDNCYHVVAGIDIDATAVMDGFIISGGNAIGGEDPWILGGGMYLLNSTLTLRRLTFKDNVASSGGGLFIEGGQPLLDQVKFLQNEAITTGGGMHIYNSNPILTRITFSYNSSYVDGGGMYNTNSHPTMTDITFLGNNADEDGGGMINDASSPLLTEVTFRLNYTGKSGGGMANRSDSNPTLRHVTFLNNNAYVEGGGMSNEGSSDPDIKDVSFSLNEAYYYGGGLYNYESNPLLVNVIFSGNTAGSGGGMYNSMCSPILINGAFSNNNTSDEGGGIYNIASDATMINVTLSGNTASDGGGMYNSYGSPTLTNAILWGNTPNQITLDSSFLDVSYSDIQGGWTGTGNINLNPQFVNSAGGDLRLQLTSPAIDAGDNTAVPADIITDLLGLPRFVDIISMLDTGSGTPPIVDMGAYEAQAVIVYLPIVTR
jgi:hypothetical protein